MKYIINTAVCLSDSVVICPYYADIWGFPWPLHGFHHMSACFKWPITLQKNTKGQILKWSFHREQKSRSFLEFNIPVKRFVSLPYCLSWLPRFSLGFFAIRCNGYWLSKLRRSETSKLLTHDYSIEQESVKGKPLNFSSKFVQQDFVYHY